MEADARYAVVGASVLALLAALVAAIIWLKDLGGRNQAQLYAINFEHQSLEGLDVGAPVNLRGIKVGRVEEYALSRDQLNRVRVLVRIDRRAPVHANAAAVVTRNVVTGIAAITLVNRDPPGPLLTEPAAGEPYPVIAEGRSDLDEFAGRVQQMGEQASSALSNINQLLNPENRRDLMATVRSLRELMTGLNQRLATLDSTLARTSAAANSVGSAARRLGDAGERAAVTLEGVGQQWGEAGRQVSTIAERTGTRLDATLNEAELVLAEARGAVGRLANSMAAVEQQTVRSVRRIEESAAGVDDQLGVAVAELRLTMEAASRVLDRLRDPHAALLGPGPAQLGPGERAP
jgi:phospholipid/cholesterol/gamma-HCH transport system substrate-binding protein